MTKLTINKTMELLNSDFTQLENTMFTIFENNCNEYDTITELLAAYNNDNFCCINGCVSELIYYYQTKEIFKNNFEEIFEYLQENYQVEVKNDYNNMVWLTFELMVNDWIYQIESLLENEEIKIYEVDEIEIDNICSILGLNLENFEE